MENCEKLAEMFQILLKSQVSAQECWKCKIVLQIRKSAEKVPSAIGTGLATIHYSNRIEQKVNKISCKF